MAREGPVDFYRLAESREFIEFLDSIYSLMGLAIGLYDPSFVSFRPEYDARRAGPLCRLIHAVPGGFERCEADGRKHCREAVFAGRAIRYLCHAGLIDILVPIFSEGRHIATLSYGQFLPAPPSRKGFEKWWRHNRHRGLDRRAAQKAYAKATYLPSDKLDAVIRILRLFADHVCEMGRRLHVLTESTQPPDIGRARQYIRDRFRQKISAADVAAYAGVSPSYFGKRFRRIVGENFVRYLQEMRVEEAKKLLQEPRRNIAEIAFESGFNSISQFNRVFRNLTGRTPSEFRLARLGSFRH